MMEAAVIEDSTLIAIAKACVVFSDSNGDNVFRISQDIWDKQLDADKVKAIGMISTTDWMSKKVNLVRHFKIALPDVGASELTATNVKVPMTGSLDLFNGVVYFFEGEATKKSYKNATQNERCLFIS